jgi:hypothetical protein
LNGEGGIRTHGTVTRTTVFEFYDSYVGLSRPVAKLLKLEPYSTVSSEKIQFNRTEQNPAIEPRAVEPMVFGIGNIVALICIAISIVFAVVTHQAANALWWALIAIFAVLWWGAKAPWGS